MNNPFKEGDVVYHTVRGKCTVIAVENAEDCHVQFEAPYSKGIVPIGSLSFDPWPEPNHTRPFEPILKEGQRVIAIERGNSSNQYYGFVSKEDKYKVVIKTLGKYNTLAKSSYFFYVEVIL